MPLVEAIQAHVFAAERIHADDTTMPVLAKERTRTGRLWTYIPDDRLFAGPAPPAAAFFHSPDGTGRHSERHLGSFAELRSQAKLCNASTGCLPSSATSSACRQRLA